MTATTDIVQKLWGLCNALRDDGISYLQYTTELTYRLFLKMTQERGMEDKLPEGYRWGDLTAKDGIEQLNFYRELLLHLGAQEAKPLVQAIYANANTALKKPITNIDELDWYSAKEEGLGDLYEGLLEKNATEKKSGRGNTLHRVS
jgi:type I restriction enzyme M protein